MPRVLTVDDSRAIRSIVSKQVTELGHEVHEATNGQEGLEKLGAGQYDLVLLDVTMPVLDGPGMLEQLRGRGDQTPVLMLTSESKRGIIASVMKLGIEDYILKPFKPEELRAKIQKVVGGEVKADGESSGGGLLLIDDVENVHKKLRTMVPESVAMAAATTSPDAITACRGGSFQAILLDTDIPGVDSTVLMGQLRLLQPDVPVVALSVRSNPDAEKEAQAHGYDGVLFKPFEANHVEEFVAQHLGGGDDVVSWADNVATVQPYRGSDDRVKRYFSRLEKRVSETVPQLADACHEELVLDLTALPAQPKETPAFVIAVQKVTESFGIKLTLVGSDEVKSTLGAFTETASLPWKDAA